MSFTTPFTRMFDIDHPVVLAPMGAISGGALAAAVSRAGGLGLIGPGYLGEDWMEREFDAAGNTRVGIGFITWDLATSPQRLDAALARRPAAVMLSFGDASPYVRKIKDAGARVIMQVQSRKMAQEAAALGADVIVAQGIEAGGHGADPIDGRSTLPLVPAIVDAVEPIPVLAAGGIADGRGVAAALTLGAAGVLIGTRFIAATQSLAHVNAKTRVSRASADETLRTRIFDIARAIDWPQKFTGRAIANNFAAQWHGRDSDLKAALESERKRYFAAVEKGDTDTMVVWSGEGLDLIQTIEPAEAIVGQLMTEAKLALEQAAALTSGH